MEEKQVTLEGDARPLPDPGSSCFATQNPWSTKGHILSSPRGRARIASYSRPSCATPEPWPVPRDPLRARTTTGASRSPRSAAPRSCSPAAPSVTRVREVDRVARRGIRSRLRRAEWPRRGSPPDLLLGASPRAGVQLLRAAKAAVARSTASRLRHTPDDGSCLRAADAGGTASSSRPRPRSRAWTPTPSPPRAVPARRTAMKPRGYRSWSRGRAKLALGIDCVRPSCWRWARCRRSSSAQCCPAFIAAIGLRDHGPTVFLRRRSAPPSRPRRRAAALIKSRAEPRQASGSPQSDRTAAAAAGAGRGAGLVRRRAAGEHRRARARRVRDRGVRRAAEIPRLVPLRSARSTPGSAAHWISLSARATSSGGCPCACVYPDLRDPPLRGEPAAWARVRRPRQRARDRQARAACSSGCASTGPTIALRSSRGPRRRGADGPSASSTTLWVSNACSSSSTRAMIMLLTLGGLTKLDHAVNTAPSCCRTSRRCEGR